MNIPKYRHNKAAGYDVASRRYRLANGTIVSREQFNRLSRTKAVSPEDRNSAYGSVVQLHRTNEADASAFLDSLIGGLTSGRPSPEVTKASGRFNSLLASIDQTPQPEAMPIPSDILAAMRLAEYYTRIYGDLFQHIETPIELSMGELVVESSDPGVKRQIEELYAQENIGMWHVLNQAWLSTAIYGSAYPLEVYENEVPKRPVMIPPKYMWVGYYVNYSGVVNGPVVTRKDERGPYYFNPPGTDRWTEALVKGTFMPISYSSFGPYWNEQITQGWGIPMNPNFLQPIRSWAMDWQRYPMPQVSRSFRPLATRAIYDELMQSTMEGFKNQLWVHILGSEANPPSPDEVTAYINMLSGASGDRTGEIVWKAPLDIKQYVPKSLNDSMSLEVRQGLTLEVFRNLGSSVRLVTGNTAQTSDRGGQGIEVDMSVWLRRLEYQRNRVLDWESSYRSRLGVRLGPAFSQAKTTVRFSRSLLEVADAIKNEIQPLYTTGLLSRTSALHRAGYNYDNELENKKKEQEGGELFAPPPSFAQTVVPGSGGGTTTSVQSPGRPPEASSFESSLQLDGVWDDKERRQQLLAEIYAAIRELLWNQNKPEDFIASLKAITTKHLNEATLESYQSAGGVGELDPRMLSFSSTYVNSFADGFLAALKEEVAANGKIAEGDFGQRAMLYGTEGWKMAVYNGQNAALAKRGAKHWQRVLHPEASKSGPCELCIADSHVMHAIEEPFMLMHPNESCSLQELGLSYYTSADKNLQVPVPNFDHEVDALLGGFGGEKHLTRRRRSK